MGAAESTPCCCVPSSGPFRDGTLRFYEAVRARAALQSSARAQTLEIQDALQGLQEFGLIWRERRDVCAIEESATDALIATLCLTK